MLRQSESYIDDFDAAQPVDRMKLIKGSAYCTSIDMIFPSDIIQYILLFDGFYHCKGVSMKWKDLCDQNEYIYMKQIYKFIGNSKANNTWIIHQHRTRLNKLEIQFGYKSIQKNITNIMDIVESGDIILIHKGRYTSSMTQRQYFDKNIQLIGVEDGVIIESIFQIGISGPFGIAKCNAYFENITFIPSERLREYSEIMRVSQNSRLYIKKCRLQFNKRAIMIEPSGYLNVNDCEFVGGSTAIQLSFATARVNIIDSIFKNCSEYGCILIDDGLISRRNDLNLVQIKCIGNIFENNLCYPMCERHSYDDIKNRIQKMVDVDRYNFKDNTLRGYNRAEVRQKVEIQDANQIYYNREPVKTSIFRF